MTLDHNEKRSHLQKIKSEVDDFHPLLQQLFPKLENIRSVDYTHGQNERGADFILEKYDPTLSQSIYVGVIAKLGKIHQDFTEIERQIDECKMSRLTEGGKKEIFLNEIWVVTNENITNNAKEKIHHKFPATSIQFIDYQKLGPPPLPRTVKLSNNPLFIPHR